MGEDGGAAYRTSDIVDKRAAESLSLSIVVSPRLRGARSTALQLYAGNVLFHDRSVKEGKARQLIAPTVEMARLFMVVRVRLAEPPVAGPFDRRFDKM